MNEHFPKIAQLKSAAALRQRIAELGWEVPVDDAILTAAAGSPLALPLQVGEFTVGNRWCIHPMEGWDANRDGSPSEHTLRRWRHFGESGAKWIWGGEAAAVQPDGRANPNQTLATPENRAGLTSLLSELLAAHRSRYGSCDDLLVGLQLTHSGRFSKPVEKLAPRIAYHHPLLDEKFHLDPRDQSVVWTDDDLERLIDRFVAAAGLAQEVGFQFVDIKACHGYLLHEFLSARTRTGKYGGDLSGRTRLLRTIIQRVRNEFPRLGVAVRLSVYDVPPYQTSRSLGQPMPYQGLLPYSYGFGANALDPLQIDLTEPIELLKQLRDLGVMAVNITCGSPYYCPHIQRPAAFPPSDGYQPPEDPLAGVCRMIDAARQCKQALRQSSGQALRQSSGQALRQSSGQALRQSSGQALRQSSGQALRQSSGQAVPDLPLVGTGYSYLQDYLPHVAQAVVRKGWIDSVGLGRMVLSYPHLPDDVLIHGVLDRKRVCRTFSDCTTAPRNGMVSGCYPLDPEYKSLSEATRVREIKEGLRGE